MAKVQFQNLIKKLPWHANFTEMNHLGRALRAKPDVLEGKMRKAFAAYDYDNAPFFYKLSSEGREEKINSSEWTWELQGTNRRPLVSMGNPNTADKPGIRNTIFQVKLDLNWFVPGDTITPGDSGKRLSVRVQNDPKPVGSGWVYDVQFVDGDPALHMPVKYLAAGQKWAKMFSPYEEGSVQSGSTTYALPMELKSNLSRFRKHHKVTGDAADEILAVGIPDSKGNIYTSWMRYAEAEFWMQWYQELETSLWYGRRSTGKLKGSSGRPVLTGPGIQQLLESGHQERYNTLSAKLIREFLLDIFFERVAPNSGKRKMVAYTGEVGMLAFHDAVTRDQASSGFIQVVDNKFIRNTTSDFAPHALSYGAQYTHYQMANGMSLELRHNPIYDNSTFHTDIDERTGKPKESARLTFFDFSGEGKDSNIKLMKKRDAFSHWYIDGAIGPYGRPNNQGTAHAGDYYEVHVLDQCGVHIEDTSRTGELILQ